MVTNSKGIFFQLFVVVFCYSLANHETDGGRISISKEEDFKDLELERQLKILNKLPIKTILMRPTTYSSPKRTIKANTSKVIQAEPSNIRTTDGIEFPEGTVPIKRTTKEDLISAKSFSKTTNRDNTIVKQDIYAGVFLEGGKYYGANADIYIYNPTVGEDQFSAAQFSLETGNKEFRLNSIQTGWIVSPQLYKDHLTRLFTYWFGNGTYVAGCYDTICPGFVQVDRSIYPSIPFLKYSTYGGKQFYVHLYVHQAKTGDWWLSCKDGINIGYWPKALFDGLKDGADRISWGGSVSVSPEGMSPPMGSGHYRDGHPNHSCYFQHVMYVDDHEELINLGLAGMINLGLAGFL